ncbi:tetratricopeptide repeat protein [Methanotorris igneus]|uniref:Tetratricopeptide repeat-containing protein n=1 Tax=Methanotorris igneus (strain DSM 5666 / JCM 11834 / Kol 5) TaxID=880724 RepID=F6BA87_METIK|nr:tetratricopeptide repeat protein [Methanotorris igneus]AEF95777.1 Tetratricopeptide repeat-containing protein [Methanotorris igneus Kol 5]
MNSLNKDEKINEFINYIGEGAFFYIKLLMAIGKCIEDNLSDEDDDLVDKLLFDENKDEDFDDDLVYEMAEETYKQWYKAWDLFKELKIKDSNLLEFYDKYNVDLERWMDDFVLVLKVLTRKDKKYVEKAKEIINYLIEHSSDEESKLIYLYELGHLYSLIGEYKKAEDIYREVIDKLPDYPITYIEYAQLLIETGRFGDAEKIMERYYENCEMVCDALYESVIGAIYLNLKERGINQISEKLRSYYNLRDKITDVTDRLYDEVGAERFKKSIKILEFPFENNTFFADEEEELAILADFMIFGSIDGVRTIDNVDESKYDNEILDALKKSKYSLFKVVSTNPKEHIVEIEDVFENKRYTVMDVMMSKTVDVGYLFTSRYVPFENYGIILVCGYAFSPKSETILLKKFKKLMKKLNYGDEETKKFIALHKLGKRYGDLMTALW